VLLPNPSELDVDPSIDFVARYKMLNILREENGGPSLSYVPSAKKKQGLVVVLWPCMSVSEIILKRRACIVET